MKVGTPSFSHFAPIEKIEFLNHYIFDHSLDIKRNSKAIYNTLVLRTFISRKAKFKIEVTRTTTRAFTN